MPTYIALLNWTDQGVKNVKDSVKRTEQARAAIEKAGGKLTSSYWTQGQYDLVAITEYPDDETASARHPRPELPQRRSHSPQSHAQGRCHRRP